MVFDTKNRKKVVVLNQCKSICLASFLPLCAAEMQIQRSVLQNFIFSYILNIGVPYHNIFFENDSPLSPVLKLQSKY